MPAIKSLRAKEILDAQGNPALHLALWVDSGEVVETSIPNGIRHYPTQANNLYDQDPHHMGGKGVQKAVLLINQTLAPQIVGQDPTQQEQIDQLLLKLDGTNNKAQVGANSMTAISQAVLKAGAAVSGLQPYDYIAQKYQLTDHFQIPVCLYGLVNGGQYGAGNLDIQEFLIIPASHSDFRVSLEIESAIKNELQKVLKEKGANYATGELGGFAPFLQKNTDVFEFIVEAARKTPYILARDFFFGIDAGASQLQDKGKYTLKDKNNGLTSSELREYYKDLQKNYSLTYFEDPFIAKDAQEWQQLTAELGQAARIASDIPTASNPQLVQQAVAQQTANTLVVKPSQIGTLTETFSAVRIAREAGWNIVVSQRTGETNDDFLADFAVGIGAEFIKLGPVSRGESVAKYNRLADIYLALENNNQEGTAMSEPTQTNIPQPTDAPAADAAPDQNQAQNQNQGQASAAQPQAPVDDALKPPASSGQPAQPSQPAQPATNQQPTGGQTPAPTSQPSINDEVSLAGTAGNNPTTNPEPDINPSGNPAVNPAAGSQPVVNQPAANQPAQAGEAQMPSPTEAPINTPPAAAPMAPVQGGETQNNPAQPSADEEQASAADTQKAIDSTLEEIGAQPNAGAAASTPQPMATEQSAADSSQPAVENN